MIIHVYLQFRWFQCSFHIWYKACHLTHDVYCSITTKRLVLASSTLSACHCTKTSLVMDNSIHISVCSRLGAYIKTSLCDDERNPDGIIVSAKPFCRNMTLTQTSIGGRNQCGLYYGTSRGWRNKAPSIPTLDEAIPPAARWTKRCAASLRVVS